jgi:hypothetical protein
MYPNNGGDGTRKPVLHLLPPVFSPLPSLLPSPDQPLQDQIFELLDTVSLTSDVVRLFVHAAYLSASGSPDLAQAAALRAVAGIGDQRGALRRDYETLDTALEEMAGSLAHLAGDGHA